MAELLPAPASSLPRRGCAFGFADDSFDLTRTPGFEPNSFAYHGDDGCKYTGSEQGDLLGPRYGEGDVVGCGIRCEDCTIFFTLNGRRVGDACVFSSTLALYPTVGLHAPGEMVEVNFGSHPFRFDVDSYILELKRELFRRVGAVPTPPVAMAVVREYCLRQGYMATHALLEDHAPVEPQTNGKPRDLSVALSPRAEAMDKLQATLEQRSRIRALILDGDLHGALERVHREFPTALDLEHVPDAVDGPPCAEASAVMPTPPPTDGEMIVDHSTPRMGPARKAYVQAVLVGMNASCGAASRSSGLFHGHPQLSAQIHSFKSRVLFHVHCQTFVELTRQQRLLEAVQYAQAQLADFRDDATFRGHLEAVMGLLAFAGMEPGTRGMGNGASADSGPVNGHGNGQTRARSAEVLAPAADGEQPVFDPALSFDRVFYGGAWTDARGDSMDDLFSNRRREFVADLVNTAICGRPWRWRRRHAMRTVRAHSTPPSPAPPLPAVVDFGAYSPPILEAGLQQLILLHAVSRALNGGYGRPLALDGATGMAPTAAAHGELPTQ